MYKLFNKRFQQWYVLTSILLECCILFSKVYHFFILSIKNKIKLLIFIIHLQKEAIQLFYNNYLFYQPLVKSSNRVIKVN
jgi:hypothetical protein